MVPPVRPTLEFPLIAGDSLPEPCPHVEDTLWDELLHVRASAGGRAEASTGEGHGRASPGRGGVGGEELYHLLRFPSCSCGTQHGGGRQPTDRHPGVRGEQTTHGKAGSELSQLGFLVLHTPALSRTLGSSLER